MRCSCCNRILSDYEATRRHATTGEFLDICNKCFKDLGIPSTVREDLKPESVVDDMEEDYVEETDQDNSLSEVPGEWR